MRQSLPFGLKCEVTRNFDLSPSEIGILRLICQTIPRSSTHDTFDQIRVVTRSNKKFDFTFIFFHRLDYNSIRICNLPDKISIVIELERSLELYIPLNQKTLNFGWDILFQLCALVSIELKLVWLLVFIFTPQS